MQKNTSDADSVRDTSPEAIREWGLRLLIDAGEATLNLAECGRAKYLQSLSQAQSNKIKRVVYGKSGNVVSVEPVALVDIVKAAADIAGTREAAKEKSKTDGKRSNKLSLEIKDGKAAQPDLESKSKSKKPTVNEILKGIKSNAGS